MGEEEAAKVKVLLANFVTLVDFLSCHCQLGHHDSCEHTLKTLDDFISHVGTMKVEWCDKMTPQSITPYFHLLEYHVGSQLIRSPFGSIAPYQLQGQESIHQEHTSIMFRATNRKGNKSYAIA